MSDEKTKVLFLRKVPQALKIKFKAWCAVHGVSMQEQILKLIQSTVKDGSSNERRG